MNRLRFVGFIALPAAPAAFFIARIARSMGRRCFLIHTISSLTASMIFWRMDRSWESSLSRWSTAP